MIKKIYQRVSRIMKNFCRSLKKEVPIYIPVFQGELLKNRVALITGGTKGIGYAMAESFLKNEATVIITGRSDDSVKKAVQSLMNDSAIKDRIFGIVMDNTNVSKFQEKFDGILKLIYPKNVDILVNNAGVIKGGSVGHFDEDGFNETLNVNLKAPAMLSEIVAKYMKDNKIQGNILNVCSSSSLRPAVSPYTMTKWGMRGLTKGFAKAFIPYGIVVNGIAPGPTATPMLISDGYDGIELQTNPTGRYATAQEIANMATILVSAMGRMIVGDVLYMTGGAGVFTYDDMEYNF
jgi:NAD(P)-dependent dehydrogenase (short-subunit alcohol dehydrogenase family)